MCAGPEIVAAAQVVGAVAGTATAVKALTAKAPSSPDVVRTDPAADDLAARTAAAQEATAATAAQKKKIRQNSLLSQAGAAGDLTAADTTSGQAQAKLSLGA